MTRTALQDAVAAQLSRIDAEMKAIGYWQARPLRPEQVCYREPFAVDTMTFRQWLQFVFIPNVRETIADNSFPDSSSVGAQAMREFDSAPEARRLTKLLSEFDALFQSTQDEPVTAD